VWKPAAVNAVTKAIQYVEQENCQAALRQLGYILHQASALQDYPELGRHIGTRGARQLPIARTPYILLYRHLPRAGRIDIPRFLHSSQQRPD
jgi:toxin ParE1/3/4